MPKRIDLSNQQFNRLTALYPSGKNKQGALMWHCQCSCGNTCDVRGSDLRRGNTGSCGCLHKEVMTRTHTTHGHANECSPTYKVWTRTVHDRVPEWDSYEVFLSQMGERPDTYSELLKIDPLEPHGPDNSYYRLKGDKRIYPDLPWMYVNLLDIARIGNKATCNGGRTASTCIR